MLLDFLIQVQYRRLDLYFGSGELSLELLNRDINYLDIVFYNRLRYQCFIVVFLGESESSRFTSGLITSHVSSNIEYKSRNSLLTSR